jgi:C-terminal processing protease CtpA/Prc
MPQSPPTRNPLQSATFRNVACLIISLTFCWPYSAVSQSTTNAPSKLSIPALLDNEFVDGSGIAFSELNAEQIDDLVTLGKVWGFLKYHHPVATSGDKNWDFELFRILPKVLRANSRSGAQHVISEWIDRLGVLPDCDPCASAPVNSHLIARLDWIQDATAVGATLGDKLMAIYERRLASAPFYAAKALPDNNLGTHFRFENAYEQFEFPDAGYRLLAVFRFWNLVEYLFPYRNLIDRAWHSVLAEYVSLVPSMTSMDEYHRQMTRLIAEIGDGHAKWRNAKGLPLSGSCYLNARFRSVEDQFVVWSKSLFSERDREGLIPGDALLAIDGQSIKSRIASAEPYFPASNRTAQLRDLSWAIARGTCIEVVVDVQRNGVEKQVRERRIDPGQLDMTRFRHIRPGDVFQVLSPDVVYLSLYAAKATDIAGYLARAKTSKGLIIDLRTYPSDVVAFALGAQLVSTPTPFSRFTRPDSGNPGAFKWGDSIVLTPRVPYFDKKVVVLVDENTQSRAEYTAMALRASPNVTIVGSQTAGADGDFVAFTLPGALRGGFSSIGVFYSDQRATQKVGIVPDVWSEPTIQGIRDGRDEVLETGLRLILGGGIDEGEIRKMAARP